jgi:CDP-diacylglycerol pyrophosphatase
MTMTTLMALCCCVVVVVVTTVDQLKPGTHGHNLLLKVVSNSIVVEKARSDRTRVRVAEVLVGDQTGTIVFTARNGTYLLLACSFVRSNIIN